MVTIAPVLIYILAPDRVFRGTPCPAHPPAPPPTPFCVACAYVLHGTGGALERGGHALQGAG